MSLMARLPAAQLNGRFLATSLSGRNLLGWAVRPRFFPRRSSLLGCKISSTRETFSYQKGLRSCSHTWAAHPRSPEMAVPQQEQSATSAPVKDSWQVGGLRTATQDPTLSGDSIRRRFLEFFAARGHEILPSSSLVPEDPTVLLTIAGMLQFKPIFLGQEPRKVTRATTSQKCARTNDIQNVGRTARHQTFFEMLGNFSFGDYFKKEAIKWAWELATKEYGLPVERLWVSVFEDDDEAYAIWKDEVGVAQERIKRMGAEDNFWSSGPTGPCGPCSEMYFDFFPERGAAPDVTLEDDERFIEFYNLVFMQYNRLDDGNLEPLKNRNIDTGMGLERMARILQKVDSNYETDLIFPILDCTAKLAGVDFETASEKARVQLKVIADHTRAVVYLISDGVTPSNVGRGYVARRLLRRIVRMGRLLGIEGDGQGNSEGAFLPIIAKMAVSLSTEIDERVAENAERIYTELRREELQFKKTLARGERLLEELLVQALSNGAGATVASRPCLGGRDVFTLYDTYGFPVEITEEVAEERGVGVDMAGFELEMEAQRQRAQAARSTVKLAVGGAAADLAAQLSPTAFIGYSDLMSESTVAALVVGGNVVSSAKAGEHVDVVLDCTPFYAEGGGQIGDQGTLTVVGPAGGLLGRLRVSDVQRGAGDLFLHRAVVEEGEVLVGARVEASVDRILRKRAQAHHTATHLLQAALKSVLGRDTAQAGSFVGFDRLRFDFNCPRAPTVDEVAAVEALVNGWIASGAPLQTTEMRLDEAKRAGAVMMFGEKYGEVVRVVDVPGISMELCGGTHVSSTTEVQGLRIVSEAGIASGVRRIEAVAGASAIEFLTQRDNVVAQLSSALKVKGEEIPGRVTMLLEELRAARNEVAQMKAQLAVTKAELAADKAELVGGLGTRVLVLELEGVEAEPLRLAAERLAAVLGDPSAVVLGSSPAAGKVSLVAAFSPALVTAGLQAGNFVGAIAKVCGGGGGGRPALAQAGGRLPEKLSEALQEAKKALSAKLEAQS